MKLSGDFDARCLRSRPRRNWRSRLVGFFVLLLWLGGLGLLAVATTSLSGAHADIQAPLGVALSLFLAGVLLIICALLLRRRARRRQSGNGDLCLAPHLMRRHG